MTKSRQRKRDYRLLVNYGHSPQMAAEIVLDAERGDEFATKWLQRVRDIASGKIKRTWP